MRGRVVFGATMLSAMSCIVLMAPVIPACAQVAPCVARFARGEDWSTLAQTIFLILAGGTLLAWLARTLVLALGTSRVVRKLPEEEVPIALGGAMDRAGVGDVVCIGSDVPLAFCAGILRPRIYVSRGLIGRLHPAELEAVLLHERHHSRRRDPARYAAAIALKDVCFYLPVVSWLVQHLRENAELRADRAAIQGAGRRSVAGALWTLGTDADSPGVAAFAGAAELRVTQLLGDPLPRRRPARSLVLTSGIGALSLVVTAACLVQLLPLH